MTSLNKDQNGLLPESIDELADILLILNTSGEVFFLKNDEDVGKSWVVHKKGALFTEINGTIFAPENLKNHHEISNSTGVVPLSNVRRLFPHYDPQMLIEFTMLLELCHAYQEVTVQSWTCWRLALPSVKYQCTLRELGVNEVC